MHPGVSPPHMRIQHTIAVAAVASLLLVACASDDTDQPGTAEVTPADDGDAIVTTDPPDDRPATEDNDADDDPDVDADDADDAGDGEAGDDGAGDEPDPDDDVEDDAADGDTDAEDTTDGDDESPWRPMTPEEAEAWREPGAAGEVFAPANRQEEITNEAHTRWYELFRPESRTRMPDWYWSNKEQLWDQLADAVVEMAAEDFGTRLRGQPGTVWPGADTPANGLFTYASHTNPPGTYGWFGVARVGIEPDDARQARPDVGLYVLQVRVDATEDPDAWVGELHRIEGPAIASGETTWHDQLIAEILAEADPLDVAWEEINPEHSEVEP